MHEIILSKAPSLLSLYLKALCKKPQPRSETPRVSTLVLRTQVNQSQLTQYKSLCGQIPDSQALPPLYPQVIAFKLHLALLLNKKMPFSAIGLVHRNNDIDYLSPIYPDDSLVIKVGLKHFKTNKKGTNCTLLTQVYVDGKLKWQAQTTYFYRQTHTTLAHRHTRKDIRFCEKPEHSKNWSLPANLGRKYANITGDLNPIHLYSFTAKLFGFQKTIAHGMCIAAKATLEVQPVEFTFPCRIYFAFNKPVYLPSQVAFTQTAEGFSVFPVLNQTMIDSPMLMGKFETTQITQNTQVLN